MTDTAKTEEGLVFLNDAWDNSLTGLGTSRDKRTASSVFPIRNTTDETFFDNIYHGDDLAAKGADLPAQEMVRNWITFSAEDENGEAMPDVIQAVNDKLKSLKSRKKFKNQIIWSRVYGSGLMFIGADDGGRGPDAMQKPLNMENIRSLNFLNVFDRFEAQIEKLDRNPVSPTHGMPIEYLLIPEGKNGIPVPGTEPVRVHASRLT